MSGKACQRWRGAIWNTADAHLVTTLHHNGEVPYPQFFPVNHRVITAGWDNPARIWNATDGALLLTLHHDGPVFRAVPSPDGERIVTISADHTARVWNSADGRLLYTLHHDGVVWHAEFSRDGRGRLLAKLQGHNSAVEDAAFFPDGQRIVTGSWDQTARVWRLLTLKEVKEMLEGK